VLVPSGGIDWHEANHGVLQRRLVRQLAGQAWPADGELWAGQNEVHTVKEFVDLPEFAIGCRLAVALATLEG